MEGAQIDTDSLITDLTINGAAMKNFKLIVEEIQRIMGQDTFSAQGGACPNVYEIAAGENI